MTFYVVASMLWALAGLAVGFTLGRAGRVFQPPKESAVPHTTSRGMADRVVGLVVVIMAVVSVIAMSISINRQERIATCQADFNTRFAAALQERNDAAARERAAQRELLTSNGDRRAAIDEYLRGLAEADQARAENPLPARPTCE